MLPILKNIMKVYQPEPTNKQRRSSVLIPLMEIDGEWHVVYEVRSGIVSQAGDASFPGGRIELNESPKDAAVRETTEELNIDENNIEVYGEMDYIANDFTIIYCYVGEIKGIAFEDIEPNEEVEMLFTIPLKKLIEEDPVLFEVSSEDTFPDDFPFERITYGKEFKFGSRNRTVPYYPNENYFLWGMTANLTYHFVDILRTFGYSIDGEVENIGEEPKEDNYSDPRL